MKVAQVVHLGKVWSREADGVADAGGRRGGRQGGSVQVQACVCKHALHRPHEVCKDFTPVSLPEHIHTRKPGSTAASR